MIQGSRSINLFSENDPDRNGVSVGLTGSHIVREADDVLIAIGYAGNELNSERSLRNLLREISRDVCMVSVEVVC